MALLCCFSCNFGYDTWWLGAWVIQRQENWDKLAGSDRIAELAKFPSCVYPSTKFGQCFDIQKPYELKGSPCVVYLSMCQINWMSQISPTLSFLGGTPLSSLSSSRVPSWAGGTAGRPESCCWSCPFRVSSNFARATARSLRALSLVAMEVLGTPSAGIGNALTCGGTSTDKSATTGDKWSEALGTFCCSSIRINSHSSAPIDYKAWGQGTLIGYWNAPIQAWVQGGPVVAKRTEEQ